MEIDIAQLAGQVAAFLAPFLPYLIKGGKIAAKKAFEKAGEKFTEAGWNEAETLWGKLKPKVETKPAVQDAIERAVKQPENKRIQDNLRNNLEFQLEDIFGEDPSLAKFVAENVIFDFSSNIATGDQSIVVGRDINRSNVIIGKDNKIIQAHTYIEGNVYRGPSPRNPQEALKIYRDVIANTTFILPLRGIDVEVSDPTSAQKPIRLASVYIALDTKTIRKKEHNAIESENPFATDLRIKLGPRSLSVLQAVIENRFVVIKGDPGSGKSTFVNYLANCLATQNTDKLENWPQTEKEILPIIIILRDFAKSLPKNLPSRAEPRHLWDFVSSRLKAHNLVASSKPILETLEHGNALIFLDGLDEVPTHEQRIFIRDAVQAFAQRYSKNRFLVTCRVLSYQPPKSKNEADLRLVSFPEFEIAPFDRSKISAFISAWYGELSNSRVSILDEDEAKDFIKKLKIAIQRPELRRLAPNPLLLTVMALVNTHKGQLPDTRAVLYEETIEILLWRWEQGNKGQEARLRYLLLKANYRNKDLEQVIWQLAYEAHAETHATKDEEDSLAGISEWKLQKALAEKYNGDLNWASQIIETMKLRAGLLLERDTGTFTFPHRSFQEYLAATYLEVQDDFVERAKRLASNFSIWREVILWAVSRRVYVRGSIIGPLALVAELCPSRIPSNPNEWNNIWLAGDILLEIGLNRVQNSELGRDLLPRVQIQLKRLIEKGHLTPRERTEAADTLARLGDPRLDMISYFPSLHLQASRAGDIKVSDAFLFCEIPFGRFLMGSDKKDDEEVHESQEPQFKYNIKHSYFMSRYPITNAQFELFVIDPEGYANDKWYTDAGTEWLKGVKQSKPPNAGGTFDLPNHPIVNVTWYEAVAFTRWLTDKLKEENAKLHLWDQDNIKEISVDLRKWEVRLPSEAEWEKAARGENGMYYPWGNEISLNQANYVESQIGSTSAVGCFPAGQSPYGLLDMSGNVWEWCATEWTDDYQYYTQREKNGLEGKAQRVLRGGAFSNQERYVRCSFRFRDFPFSKYFNVGFRVVACLM